MYDSHIYCKEYKELKDYIVDILNGEIENYDVEKLSNHIQELYDNNEMCARVIKGRCRVCKLQRK